MENREFYSKLDNFITAHRYVNLFSRRFGENSESAVDPVTFLTGLTTEYGAPLLDIDIRHFHDCQDEEEESAVFRRLILEKIKGKGPEIQMQTAISISEGMQQLSRILEGRTLLVFYLFADIHHEKERDILRSIRKYIEIYDKSAFLALLVISDRPTHQWELYPESRLDERHLAYLEYPQI